MLKTKRLLTNNELDTFIKLREESNIKAARYMKSLQQELYEVIEEEYDGYNTGQGNFKATED